MAEYDMTFDQPFVAYDDSKTSQILLDIFKQMHLKF